MSKSPFGSPNFTQMADQLSHADAELIRLCEQHVRNRKAWENCPLDSDDNPWWPDYSATREAVLDAKPKTAEGVVAKALATVDEFDVGKGQPLFERDPAARWALGIVGDLIRVAPDNWEHAWQAATRIARGV